MKKELGNFAADGIRGSEEREEQSVAEVTFVQDLPREGEREREWHEEKHAIRLTCCPHPPNG